MNARPVVLVVIRNYTSAGMETFLTAKHAFNCIHQFAVIVTTGSLVLKKPCHVLHIALRYHVFQTTYNRMTGFGHYCMIRFIGNVRVIDNGISGILLNEVHQLL